MEIEDLQNFTKNEISKMFVDVDLKAFANDLLDKTIKKVESLEKDIISNDKYQSFKREQEREQWKYRKRKKYDYR